MAVAEFIRKIPVKLASRFVLAICPLGVLHAQSVAPRAYVITPLHANAITLTWAFYDGGVNLNGTIPITGATGTYSVPVFSYYHSFSFLGRSANFTATLPYGVGTPLSRQRDRAHPNRDFRAAAMARTRTIHGQSTLSK